MQGPVPAQTLPDSRWVPETEMGIHISAVTGSRSLREPQFPLFLNGMSSHADGPLVCSHLRQPTALPFCPSLCEERTVWSGWGCTQSTGATTAGVSRGSGTLQSQGWDGVKPSAPPPFLSPVCLQSDDLPVHQRGVQRRPSCLCPGSLGLHGSGAPARAAWGRSWSWVPAPPSQTQISHIDSLSTSKQSSCQGSGCFSTFFCTSLWVLRRAPGRGPSGHR